MAKMEYSKRVNSEKKPRNRTACTVRYHTCLGMGGHDQTCWSVFRLLMEIREIVKEMPLGQRNWDLQIAGRKEADFSPNALCTV